MRASDVAFVTKILQMCWLYKWNSNIFLHKNLFHRTKGQKRAKRPNTFFTASQHDEAKKGQLKYFKPTNLKRGQISEISGLKKTNLATLRLS